MKIPEKEKSFVLITVLMLISAILFLGSSFTFAVINENKMARSQAQAIRAYYLAESGMQEALWKVQNNEEWKTNFETDPDWEAEISRQDVFSIGSEFNVRINNSDIGDAEIISAGMRKIDGVLSARRISKLNVFKTVSPPSEEVDSSEEEDSGESAQSGDLPIELEMDNTAILASGGINLWGMNLDCQGNVFSEEDLAISLWSNVGVQGSVKSCGNINVDAASFLSAAALYSLNNPPQSESMDMPAAGFDAEGDADSLKALAQSLGQVYTASQFAALISENPARGFSGSVYITGSAILGEDADISINGALALDGSLTLGNDWQWWDPCGANDAKITITALDGKPSGIFSKNQIVIKTCVGDIDISGVMYAGNSIAFSSISSNFSVRGAVVSRNIEGTGLWNPVTVSFDEAITENSLRAESGFAPLIDSAYWED